MNSNNRSYHHDGASVHPKYTSYISNTNALPSGSTNHLSSYTNSLPNSTGKQQQQQPQQSQQHDSNQPQQSQQQDSNQPRKRTRATFDQLAILEKTFGVNPSPTNRVREQLSRDLGMSERSIQIWFQNRRAKVKNMAKRSSLMHDETMRMQYYAATAAAAACHAANSQQQQHTSPDGTPVSNTDLYYYYYYYYYNQQQQHGLYGSDGTSWPLSSHMKSTTQSTPPPPPPMPGTSSDVNNPWTALSTPPPPPPPPLSSPNPVSIYYQQQQQQQQRHYMSPSSSTSSSTSNPSSTSAITTDAAGGRIRSHSVGHYPYKPYQRHGSRPGSSEPATGYFHRRHHSSSASPAPPAVPTHMWHSSQPSALMLNPSDMIPEETATSTAYVSDWPSDADSVTNQGVFPLPMSVVQDEERLGTRMSMDDYGNYIENDCGTSHYRISGEALQIGTWKRMSLQPQDLECFYDRQLRCMVWRIRDGQQQFKMHIMVNSIEKVQLDPLAERLGWARLSLTVNQPEMICFYMEEGGGSWTQCRDFTQDRQATSVPTHSIDGPALALRAEWMRLMGQDQHLRNLFQNNMIQPTQQQQVMDPNQLYHTAHGPHGQSMLSNSTPSRDVTPADMMMVLQQDDNQQSMLFLMEKDQGKNQGAQDLLLFQGV